MRIGIDATSLCRKTTGIESYTLNLIKALLEYDHENNYTIFFRGQVHPLLLQYKKNAKFRIAPISNQIYCEQIWLPYMAVQERVDLIHFPAFPPSPFISKQFVLTIHDAAMWYYPENLSWKGRHYFRFLSNIAALRTSKIITVSEFSRKEIGNYLKKIKAGIENCGESISDVFYNEINRESLNEITKMLRLPEKFILSVNSLEPRKNIPNLLKAFKLLKESNSSFQHKLVLVGRKAWGKDLIFSEINRLNLEGEVISTGYLEPGYLPSFYHLADVFIYPSLYEGFGLPPLEAMASGIPVIASDIPPLKEILGDAAFFIDPYDPKNIAEGLRNVLENMQLRGYLIKKGFNKSKGYSWQEVAKKTIKVYELIATPDKRISLLKTNINNISFDDALGQIKILIEKNENKFIVTPNVDHLVRLDKDQELQGIYNNASLVLPDGVPILWASKFLGTPLKEKISGSDLFPRLCKIAAEKGYKLFFLGGREGAAEKAAEVLRVKHPSLQIVGIDSPPFGFENDSRENDKIIQMIKDARPDILFVGLGSPKQEKWIYKHKDKYQVPISIGIGVSFEFVSGMVKRSPVWMQKVGLEWFWRVLMEPKRLWKRYLINDMHFFVLVLRQKFFRR